MDGIKLNLNKDTICTTILILFSLFCTLKMCTFCLSGGILNPDVSLYLISGLKYAGIDYFNIANPEDLYYTPVVSFLSSLIFRMGIVDKAAIIIVTSILCFVGYIGLYYFLKLRFNSLLSLTGVIIYGSTTIIIFNICKGLIDVPALSISICALYFAVLAIDNNPKYFLISFPLLVISFFTKYIAGFILPLIFLYYLMNRDFIGNLDNLFSNRELLKNKIKNYLSSAEFKYIVISAIISILLAIIICKTLILDFGGHLTFFEQSVNTFNLHSDNSSAVYIPDKSYYIDKFHLLLFDQYPHGLILSQLLYGIFGISIIINIINFIQNRKRENPDAYQTRYFKKILLILFILLMSASFIGFKFLEDNMVSNICFLASMLILHSILKNYSDNKYLSMTILYFAFFGVYFIFQSLYCIRIYRYSLPMIMPFICIIVWSLDSIFTALTNGLGGSAIDGPNKDYSKLSNCILIILLMIFLISTLAFIAPMEYERTNLVYGDVCYKGYSNDLTDACDYISQTDPDYHSKTYTSFPHSSRTIRWLMNVNVTKVAEDEPDFENYDNSTYLILYENRTFNNYHLLHNCGDFNIYLHN